MSRLRPGSLALLATCLALRAAFAQEPGPGINEVRDLRVSLPPGGGLRLDWTAPRASPDAYQVRRCVLPSVRVPYYGNCIAQGLTVRTYDDAPPAGSFFYLVSGDYAGVEGSLGNQWDGTTATPRTAPPCNQPETPVPVTLVVRLDADQHICGTNITVRFPTEALTFNAASCTGIASSFFPTTNDTVPGRVRHACVSATGARTPGEVSALQFQRGACPVTVDVFDVIACDITIGQPDCSAPVTVSQPCMLTLN